MMTKAVWYYRSATGEDLSLEDLKEWDLGYMRHAFEKIWRIPGFFADLPFMDEDAQSVLRVLSLRGHEIVIVSAPPTWESCLGKYSWVHTNLRIPRIIDGMGPLVLTRNKHYIEGDVMVDDKPENLEGRECPILFSRPWNEGVTPYPRAYTWSGVLRVIENYERGAA